MFDYDPCGDPGGCWSDCDSGSPCDADDIVYHHYLPYLRDNVMWKFIHEELLSLVGPVVALWEFKQYPSIERCSELLSL